VKGNVPVAEATRDEAVLPERVQEALGQLVGGSERRTAGAQRRCRARCADRVDGG
jgi:hypothetical protein